nr:hypothetical protein [Tanacetum cinerariifolium]
YTSCIEQFWTTIKAKTINEEGQLQALVDGKKILITESTIRRDLQLKNDEGVDCLPNAVILNNLHSWDEAVNEEMDGKINTDYQLAERLQAEEQQELNDKENAKLFMKLLEKRRKFFAAKRAEEKKNKLPTHA